MGRRVIRLGDPTTHGGTVVSATVGYIMFGKEVAGKGDKAICPIPGHGAVTIVEGDPTWTVNGKNVALEGHKCSCGCSLISTLPNVTRSYEGDGAASASAVVKGTAAAAATAALAALAATAHGEKYDLFFHVKRANTGNSLSNVPYKITLEDGRIFTGITDGKGYTEIVSSDYSQDAKLEAPYYGDSSNTSNNCHANTDHGSDTCCC